MEKIRKGDRELRKVFCESLAELMEADPDVVYLEADLAGAIGTTDLFKQYPGQAFNVGIQEANMVGVASGMSLKGKKPFVHSFGTFSSRRVADQVFLSACYNHANVNMIGSDPGISAEANGGTHMPLEDIGVLRSIPGITILDVSDPYLLRRVIRLISDTYGVFYVRFPRKAKTHFYHGDETIAIGKGNILKEGTDASVIAAGIETEEALKAAGILEKENIHVRVVDMFTIKPIDRELIIRCARETGAVVTAENHNILGGLGSAVAEVLAENCPVPMRRIGVNDQFGEVGTRDFLSDKYQLNAESIVDAVRTVCRQKENR